MRTTGWLHNVAVRSNGTVVAWGDGFYGQTNVSSLWSNVTLSAGGATHHTAVNGARAVAWGANYFDQADPPVGLTNISALAAGGYHNLAIGTLLPLTFNTQGTNLTMSSNGMRMRLDYAQRTGPVVIYSSSDLTMWSPLFTNPPVNGSLSYVDQTATNAKSRFYRAEQR